MDWFSIIVMAFALFGFICAVFLFLIFIIFFNNYRGGK